MIQEMILATILLQYASVFNIFQLSCLFLALWEFILEMRKSYLMSLQIMEINQKEQSLVRLIIVACSYNIKNWRLKQQKRFKFIDNRQTFPGVLLSMAFLFIFLIVKQMLKCPI